MPASRLTRAAIVFLYFCAALQFVRFYSKSTTLYLNMGSYLAGHERLPFQERVLPIVFLAPIMHSRWIAEHWFHSNGNFSAERGPFYVLSLIALLVAALFTQKLYRALTRTGSLSLLVFPVFLFAVIWTYSIHSEANFSYPYDMLGLAFFTVGMYAIYKKYFWALALIVLLGTFNRETTLFLIGLYLIDAASVESASPGRDRLRDRFRFQGLPWAPVLLRALLLALVWLAVRLPLAHAFAGNDTSENYVRIGYNLNLLRIRLLPALLNICGYTLPVVLLLRGDLRPQRFRNYLWILPVWFAVMFYSGVIVETRIYGELCSYSAIALVLIVERRLEQSRDAEREPAGDAPVAVLPVLEPTFEPTLTRSGAPETPNDPGGGLALRRYSWAVLAYNVLIVLWGAVVRATGSGNGCGEHWPLCGGTVVQHWQTLASVIEFAHRASVGLGVLALLVLFAWVWRATPRRHLARVFVAAAGVLTLNEAVLGALLVLLGLTAGNQSPLRGVMLSLHLANTLLLLAALALTAHFLGRVNGRMRGGVQLHGATLASAGLLATLLVGVSGSLAALGDTLYPAHSLAQAFHQDFAAGGSFLLHIRWIHPTLSLVAAGWIAFLLAQSRRTGNRRWGASLLALVLLQFVIGAADVLLLAPLWLQIAHLLGADLLWIALVVLTAQLCIRPLGCTLGLCARPAARAVSFAKPEGDNPRQEITAGRVGGFTV